MIVIDASLIIALILGEDNVADPASIYDLLRVTPISVPAHWPAEVANALWANQRRGRITADMVNTAVDYLATFKPRIDAAPALDSLSGLVKFAEKEKLSVYDAVYVQLALSNNAILATIDGDVRASAKRLDIPVLPE